MTRTSTIDEFWRSQKDVSQYIVAGLEEAAFHTAEELARPANTSSSTVVRFAQPLGFEGFPELQIPARDEYGRARDIRHRRRLEALDRLTRPGSASTSSLVRWIHSSSGAAARG